MKIVKYLLVLVILAVAASAAAIHFAPAQAADFLVDLKRKIGGLETKEMTLDNGLTYVYMEANADKAETLVLLHGFGADKDNFTEVAPYLRDYHLIVPDHIGFGDSSKPQNADYTPPAQAARLHELLGKIGVNTFSMGGSSMGGHIALTYAAMYPNQVQSLWLLDPGGFWSAPKSEFLLHFEETGENILSARTLKEFHGVFDFVMSKPPFVPGFVLDQKAQSRIDNYALEQQIFKQLGEDQLEARIKGMPVPALLVWGKEDRVLSAGAVPVVESLLPNVKTVLMDGIGHLPMLEAPYQTATDLKEFLALLPES
ncbi:MAG: alpha/beta hydrolase [Oleibacter sp.]|nr:alpha/beta hydrolase [Thalassolituus sp.]